MPVKSEVLELVTDGVENLESWRKTSVKRQYFAVIVMDLLAFSYGASCGWTSASIPILKSEETPFETGPISTNEASWIASGICVGGFVGNLIIGWVIIDIQIELDNCELKALIIFKLSTRIGQKLALCVVSIPQILGWLLIYYATNPLLLIVSRVLSGLAGGGVYAIIPGYISEISDDEVRGTLGSTLVFACNLGLFCAFVFGEYLQYLTIPWFMVSVTLIFLVLFRRVPDSAVFLAKRNLYEVSFWRVEIFSKNKNCILYLGSGTISDILQEHQ